ncbi:MAG: efflux transporter outer membrane subunit [Gammaproteobacteria bacterium]|nr:efflux transporter outer membrane subunit [Gammaproteobacteria bacterium]MCP5424379.1 efflux transporter outer membrane subunit [Gammaproteobacteria bacterium]
MRLLTATIVIALSGCAVGPDYQPPTIDTPDTWRLTLDEGTDYSNSAWWRSFQDPVLDQLIQQALKDNKDLKIAAAVIEEYMGRYGATRANQFPQLDASGSAIRGRSAESERLPGTDAVGESYRIDLNAYFEIDFWGRLRRATEAARADLLASEEARRTVVLTLVSAVASSYINLRELDKELDISRETLKTREESVRIARLRFQAGLTSEQPYQQAVAEYQAAALKIPLLEKRIAQQENALSLLLGRNPAPIDRGRGLNELAMPGVPQGLPSTLLVRRPDIRQAEQQLIAANALIGVARAEYFPTISLTGALGSASSDLSDLFSGPARTWSYGGALLAPIFTAGKIAGQVQVAEAQQQQALLNYQQTIQTAFSEVDDSLVDLSKSQEQYEAQKKQVEAYSRYAHLAQLRYDNGYTSYLEVVDAQRNLFESELALTQNKGSVFLAVINLYKAMGGGWVTEAETLAQVEPDPSNDGQAQHPSQP